MKKLLLIAVLIAACLSATAYVACVAAPLLGKNIKGSGKIVAKTVPAPDFDGIEASRAVKVVISDKVSDIRIEADDNLIDLVVVRAVKGKLEATLDQKVNNIQNGNVTITVPANGKIRSLDASSASKIIGESRAMRRSGPTGSRSRLRAPPRSKPRWKPSPAPSKHRAPRRSRPRSRPKAVRSTHRAHRKSSSKVPPGRSGPT